MDVQMMRNCVPMLVPPSKPTPYEVIPLAGGSVLAGLNTLTHTHFLIFKPTHGTGLGGARASDIIRSGLAQVLVPYYPLAGRIVQNESGWEVQCDGRGAVFIVTTAPDFEEEIVAQQPVRMNIPVTTASDLQTAVLPLPPPAHPPPDQPTSILPTLLVQVTEIETGGFTLAIKLYRGLCDAAGMMHFLCGWAEMARGSPQVSVLPFWGEKRMPRGFFSTMAINDIDGVQTPSSTLTSPCYQIHLPNLEKQAGEGFSDAHSIVSCPHHGRALSGPPMERIKVEIPLEMISYLMEDIFQLDRACTISHALMAHVWRERTRALHIPSNAEARLFFKSTSEPFYPLAFYGSFAFNCQAKARVEDLLDKPLSYAAQLLVNAEAKLESDFTNTTNDFKWVHCSCGYVPMEVLVFTSLPVINADEILDFGVLGKPSTTLLNDIHFPSNVNIAAILRPAHAQESVVTILMNNIPVAQVNDLQSCLSSLPSSLAPRASKGLSRM